MGHIVLATSGSFGDLHPYLAVGLELRARGHVVTVATSEFYREKVTAEGLRFSPLRPNYVPMAGPADIVRQTFEPHTGASFLLRHLVLPHVEETYQDLLESCRDANLLISHPTLFPAPLVAEKLNLKWISIVLSPGVFVSAYDPPVLPPVAWMHPLRHLGPLPHKVLIHAMKAVTRSWMEPIARIRRREGLRPAGCSAMHDDMFSPYGTLAWYSPLLGEKQKDWPTPSCITGFPIYDRKSPGQAVDRALEDFLGRGDPPVVFTLGSSAVVDAGDFFEQSLEATKRVGCRAVFLAGRDADLHQRQDENIFVASYVPYSEIFTRASAVVHQGGIGTTGQALHAGVPTLVVPLGLDQPDNAYRAKRLGVARVLSRSRYTAAAAAEHLGVLLNSPSYAEAARRAGTLARAECGVKTACDAIESVVLSSHLSSRVNDESSASGLCV